MNLDCIECWGDYRENDEPGVYECSQCGHRLDRVELIEATFAELREAGFDELAERLVCRQGGGR